MGHKEVKRRGKDKRCDLIGPMKKGTKIERTPRAREERKRRKRNANILFLIP